jgi:hypothetical protein
MAAPNQSFYGRDLPAAALQSCGGSYALSRHFIEPLSA